MGQAVVETPPAGGCGGYPVSLPYHDGEFEVQARTDEFDRAVQMAGAIRAELVPPVAAMLREQRWIVIGGRDKGGGMWASVLAGPPGLVTAADPTTVHIQAVPAPADPLRCLADEPSHVGLLVIDLGRRRRVRINGLCRPQADSLVVDVQQVYPNCMKYIQRRTLLDTPPSFPPASSDVGDAFPHGGLEGLPALRGVDTFFLASAHPDGPADVSHRGGAPGFLRPVGPRTVEWPDYVGNAMFNTLGNLHLDPRVGLLVIDFATGDLLQLSGYAVVDYDSPRIGQYPGAQRLLTMEVQHIRCRDGAFPFRYGEPELSPFLPQPARKP